MPRIKDTAEVRAILAEWADDTSDPIRADHAQEAYLSTGGIQGADGPIFFLTVDADMLAELRGRVRVDELPDG